MARTSPRSRVVLSCFSLHIARLYSLRITLGSYDFCWRVL